MNVELPFKSVELSYRCPGENYPITRAVHLGRLASFYPACRNCPHREDTYTLAAEQVRGLDAIRRREEPEELFHDEGVDGVYGNQLSAQLAKRIGCALGISILRECRDSTTETTVVLGDDGRPLAAELIAAVAEGLRLAGCQVISLVGVTAGCLRMAMDHFHAAGGLLVGNPSGTPYRVGLKLWGQQGRPLSAGGGLDVVRAGFLQGFNRPTRRLGSLRRCNVEQEYLARLRPHYHALRPLKFVLATACGPLWKYIEQLLESVACQVIPSPATATSGIAEQIRDCRAHFGLWIDGDGETCQLLDERGTLVAGEQLVLLLARHLLVQQPAAPIVLEQDSQQETVQQIQQLGGPVINSRASRAEMDEAMRAERAIVAGGPSGRIWLANPQPTADALATITLLLEILSQSDRQLSEVLA